MSGLGPATVGEVGALLDQLVRSADVGVAILDEDARYLYINQALAGAYGQRAEDDLHRTLAEVRPPEVVAWAEPLLQRVRATGRPVLDAVVSLPARRWQVSFFPLDLAGRGYVGVLAHDVTDRETALEHIRALWRQRAAVATLTQQALERGEFWALLEHAARLLIDHLDLAVAAALVPAGAGDTLTVAAVARPAGQMSAGADELVAAVTPALASDGPVVLELDGDRAVAARVAPGGELRAVLAMRLAPGRAVTPEDTELVGVVAGVLTAAVQRAAVEGELAELAQQRRRLVKESLESGERKRGRIADVLHDDVLQLLLFARQEAGVDEAGTRVRDSIDQAIGLLRGAVDELHPASLPSADLPAMLADLVQKHCERTHCVVDLSIDPAAAGEHDALVTTAVRELLDNVAAHAPGCAASVTVAAEPGAVVVEVGDRGPGLDPDRLEGAVAHGRVGLASLRESVGVLGGRIEIGPGADGAGTCVRITLPRATATAAPSSA